MREQADRDMGDAKQRRPYSDIAPQICRDRIRSCTQDIERPEQQRPRQEE
jgi:hypothetical protein